MKRFLYFFSALLIAFSACFAAPNVNAASDSDLYVNLTTLEYSADKNSYKTITEYENLSAFLAAKETNSLPKIFVTDFLYDGVDVVKTPDLDDFVEAASNDVEIEDLEIKVINVNTLGRVEFSGEISGAMIGVNTNEKTGDLDIIFNDAKLDTNSKKAPAIYVYNKDRNSTDCKVTIETVAGSENYIEGGKLKKVSLLDSANLSQYRSNYSGENITNFDSYTNYYGIYDSNQIKNILFATVTADNEDLGDGDPLYFYKASGAISSDIDLYFEGEGYLEVTSKNKEGIETKGNLTFSGGTGDYAIFAQDDCLNTTTAARAGETVHNTMTINVNSLLAVVSDDGDEGDAIDSNGTLEITDGTIYAFAHSNSQDSGLDSNSGTTIKNATIIATGNMADAVTTDQDKIFVQFNQKISAGTPLVAKDENDEIIVAFETQKDISTLLYTTPTLELGSYKWYAGGEIAGDQTNGLYTSVSSYSGGTEVAFSVIGDMTNMGQTTTKASRSQMLFVVWLCEITALALTLFGIWFVRKMKNK